MASQTGYFNVQQFTDAGLPLVSGRLYTYAFGTTTQKIAYTDADGLVAQTYTLDDSDVPYIALNARGELPAPLYLSAGAYDLALKRADGSTVWTRRADGSNLATSAGASGVGFLQSGTGAVLRTVQDKERDTISVKDFGATGDGTTDDTTAIQAALATGKSIRWPDGTYGISAPLGIRTGTSWLANAGKTVIKALAAFSGTSMVYDFTASTSLVIRDIELNGNSVAASCIKTTLSNTNGFVLNNVYAHGATSHGVYLVKAIGASLISVNSASNGGDGFRLEDSNAAALVNCRAVSNTGNGLLVQKGANSFSSGIRVFGGDYESNGDNGINIVNSSTVTYVAGAWVEANTNDGIKAGSSTTYVPVSIKDCNILIAANGGATNWAVNLAAGARGNVNDNFLFNSSGSRNFVYDGSDGQIDTCGNLNGNAGEPKETKFPNGSASVTCVSNARYEAEKFWTGPGSTASYTAILTAKAQSSIEVTIMGTDNNSSNQGTFVMKTWTTANALTRVSFGEIGSTNAKTAGVYYYPIGTDAEAPLVRWNGNNLEIKQGSSGSDRMVVKVCATFADPTVGTPSWLV